MWKFLYIENCFAEARLGDEILDPGGGMHEAYWLIHAYLILLLEGYSNLRDKQTLKENSTDA